MSLEFSQELDNPIISPTFAPQDAGEIGLRPKLLSDYTGQEKAKGNLSIFIEAARKREEALDHVLLHGPPGLGKTTLAGIVAREMGIIVITAETRRFLSKSSASIPKTVSLNWKGTPIQAASLNA